MGNAARRALSLKPDTAYNLMHSVLFGFLALSTMRYCPVCLSVCLSDLLSYLTALCLT